MAERLFVFVQMEFPWELGPASGRYLLRREGGEEPERIVVLETLAAGVRRARRPRRVQREAAAAPVAVSRVTVIDPVPLASEAQARRWLKELDRERESARAASVINRVLFAHRLAVADPYLHEVSAAGAMVVRAGWGSGEELAEGRFRVADELPSSATSPRRRLAALRPLERLAALLGGRGQALLCEEFALRARHDLDQARPAHAALELERAYAAALVELPAEGRAELLTRIDELRRLAPSLARLASAVLDGSGAGRCLASEQRQLVSDALGRLEAALRARTAAGV